MLEILVWYPIVVFRRLVKLLINGIVVHEYKAGICWNIKNENGIVRIFEWGTDDLLPLMHSLL